jgi:hypothetical protein
LHEFMWIKILFISQFFEVFQLSFLKNKKIFF